MKSKYQVMAYNHGYEVKSMFATTQKEVASFIDSIKILYSEVNLIVVHDRRNPAITKNTDHVKESRGWKKYHWNFENEQQ